MEHEELQISRLDERFEGRAPGTLMPSRMAPSYINFKKGAYPWKPGIDYRAHAMNAIAWARANKAS